MKNLIKAAFATAVRDQITTGIAAVEQLAVSGNLRALTADERQKYGSINEINKLLVSPGLPHHHPAA